MSALDVYITDKALGKLYAFADECPIEISGFGLGYLTDDGTPVIVDLTIPKQKCSGAETDMDKEDIYRIVQEAAEEDLRLLCWWHSHAQMEVFFSGTDEATIRDFGSPWMINIVVNKKHELKMRVDLFPQMDVKFAPHIEMDVKLNVLYASVDRDEIKALVEKYVTKGVPAVTVFQGGAWNGHPYDAAKINQELEKEGLRRAVYQQPGSKWDTKFGCWVVEIDDDGTDAVGQGRKDDGLGKAGKKNGNRKSGTGSSASSRKGRSFLDGDPGGNGEDSRLSNGFSNELTGLNPDEPPITPLCCDQCSMLYNCEQEGTFDITTDPEDVICPFWGLSLELLYRLSEDEIEMISAQVQRMAELEEDKGESTKGSKDSESSEEKAVSFWPGNVP